MCHNQTACRNNENASEVQRNMTKKHDSYRQTTRYGVKSHIVSPLLPGCHLPKVVRLTPRADLRDVCDLIVHLINASSGGGPTKKNNMKFSFNNNLLTYRFLIEARSIEAASFRTIDQVG